MTAAAALIARFAGSRLLAASTLGDPDAQSVVLGEGADRLDVVVIRVGGAISAFVNECPHAFTTLETFDGQFLDREDPDILVCSTHGARFRRGDGLCVAGPCRDKRLIPVPLHIADGEIAIAATSR
ncbi:MAG: hypothetical protein C0606_14915 [Hyphomicrobiales bacterium]|nr:MAG: hypothetical protein C0606_14915 [Hyphomicrobiales bacterium]